MAASFKQTVSKTHSLLSGLQHTRIALPNVSKMVIETTSKGDGSTGLRFFAKKALPIVKYHNPSLPVIRTSGEAPAIKVTFKSGRESTVSAKNLTSSEILSKLLDANAENGNFSFAAGSN